MGNRKIAQMSTGGEDDEQQPWMKKLRLQDEDEDEDGPAEAEIREGDENGEDHNGEEEEEEEEKVLEDAKPIGDPVRVSGEGEERRSHFEAFEFEGCRFELEDPVLLVPDDVHKQKPHVAIIKDIAQNRDGEVKVIAQYFFRPEEAERKGGGNWILNDARELFYSSHRNEAPAESVMHTCVVHFIPENKPLPIRQQHPGFIVQKVYDVEECKLCKLTDKDCGDKLHHEIDLLVQETMARLGELPDLVEAENVAPEQEDPLKGQRMAKRRTTPPPDVSREDDAPARPDRPLKGNTHGSCAANTLEDSDILSKFGALTRENHRDRWLERLLQGIKFMCKSAENIDADDEGKANQVERNFFIWPDDAVRAVSALERAAYDALFSDFQKYNQKMRQLLYNLKINSQLSRRLLNGELEPSKILKMTPNELKEGLTAEEKAPKEPEKSSHIEMTKASCSRCREKQVGLKEIIKAGRRDRYQLECIACGHTWYASRDEFLALTVDDAPSSAKTVGAAPWATAKFEAIEKKLIGTQGEESDAYKRTTEAYMPIFEPSKVAAKPKTTKDNMEPTRKA